VNLPAPELRGTSSTMPRPTHPFDVKSRDLLAIALPASLAFITEPLAGISDITVIGRLGDASMLGGLVLGALAFDYIFSLAYFLRVGTAGLTAQAVGARDPREGLVHLLRAIVLGMFIGIVLIALQGPILALAGGLLAPEAGALDAMRRYFAVRIWSAPFSLINYALLGWFYGRARATTGLLLQSLVHGVDMALSIWFVYGLSWSIEGAAFGTVLGQVAAALVGLVLVVHHLGGLSALKNAIRLRELTEATALKRMFALSRDITIRSAALMGAYAYFAAQGARAGDVTLSANAILLNYLMISGFFLDGIAQAAEQLTGKALGANYRPAFDQAYRLSFRWGLLVAAGLALTLMLGGRVLIEFMTTNAEIRASAQTYLWLAAISALTGMPAFVFDGILIGTTLSTTMRNGMIAALLVFLLGASVLGGLGNTGLWLALHVFFLARAGFYWWGLERRRSALFAV